MIELTRLKLKFLSVNLTFLSVYSKLIFYYFYVVCFNWVFGLREYSVAYHVVGCIVIKYINLKKFLLFFDSESFLFLI